MGKIENYVNFEQLNKCFTNSMCLASELYDIDDVSNTLCNASIKYENSISLM